ncbi:MAG: acetylornithine transaminase, partial [Clostridia bacterium]|nr:acetylornithine transaminase [Clostridia bacterium]
IDFGSGIGVNSLGYSNEKWAMAVARQAARLQHTSNLYYTLPQTELSQKLCGLTGYSAVFFGNSGAEANECAIKVARKYSFDNYGEGRNKIITLVNSFHGRTVTTLSATGQDVFHNYFFPFTGGFDYVEAGSIQQLKEKLDGTVCAVMFEFIQGEGGVLPLDRDFVEELFTLCKENDIITIADEVQTGMGRTGTLLASELFGVSPDITTLAKGLGGGLPIGACMVGEKLAGVMGPGTHGSTFGGNPVCCAGANAVLDEISKQEFLDEVTKKGDLLAACAEEMPHVVSVTGAGLMCGVELDGSVSAKDIAAKCLENGLLILTAKTKLRFLPPLNITKIELEKGINILSKVLEEA